MKARLLCSVGVAAILLVGMLALVSSTQAQTLVLPEPTIEILEDSPDSIFVFGVSPDTAQIGESVSVMYAWGYMGDPTQSMTVTTSFPLGVDPGGCPGGCTTVMHILRDPWGGPGLSITIPATTTLTGQHTLVAHFQDDMGVSQTLTATLTVVQAPPTAVSLTGMSANPKAPQIPWPLFALVLFVFVASFLLVRRRAHVYIE